MSQSVVPRADRQGSQSVTETAIIVPDARCFPQHAPSVARTPKYPLNLAVISRFTVAIATVKSDRTGNAVVQAQNVDGLIKISPSTFLECVVYYVITSLNT